MSAGAFADALARLVPVDEVARMFDERAVQCSTPKANASTASLTITAMTETIV